MPTQRNSCKAGLPFHPPPRRRRFVLGRLTIFQFSRQSATFGKFRPVHLAGVRSQGDVPLGVIAVGKVSWYSFHDCDEQLLNLHCMSRLFRSLKWAVESCGQHVCGLWCKRTPRDAAWIAWSQLLPTLVVSMKSHGVGFSHCCSTFSWQPSDCSHGQVPIQARSRARFCLYAGFYLRRYVAFLAGYLSLGSLLLISGYR